MINGGDRIPLLLIIFFFLLTLFIFIIIITTPGVASLRPLVFEGKGTQRARHRPQPQKRGAQACLFQSMGVYSRRTREVHKLYHIIDIHHKACGAARAVTP